MQVSSCARCDGRVTESEVPERLGPGPVRVLSGERYGAKGER